MPSKRDPVREERIRKMVGQGLTDKVIATRLGMASSSVASARVAFGLAANRDDRL